MRPGPLAPDTAHPVPSTRRFPSRPAISPGSKARWSRGKRSPNDGLANGSRSEDATSSTGIAYDTHRRGHGRSTHPWGGTTEQTGQPTARIPAVERLGSLNPGRTQPEAKSGVGQQLFQTTGDGRRVVGRGQQSVHVVRQRFGDSTDRS